ncbi:hypothetical protein SPRG_20525 [Saprolegnia parasitica CBS 223.65]|uniref:Uncharacterized protein n=1 Tax=Saprolegnia parasitica (strain CBS 223.65) TaxID=695850 RepID=A0A067C8C5_SAPPC|nr:hypothetical protein SPRG_20525 [Saprolegnia parasitica CBS 223.65]KDO26728.1 hypothetical protein SPRG_20525 [Saprolegnia parasitica CBS 223.65]|eukprot:XP_012202610.1 hypothetical protein SPRG_20525 [Saprolegnia parasitica CBS 223.65]
MAQARYMYPSTSVEASNAADAFTFYAMYAPSEMTALAQTWLESTMSFRPIYHLLKDHGDVLRRHASVHACVVQAGIDRAQQGQPIEMGLVAADAMAYFLQCSDDEADASAVDAATTTT